MNILAYCWQAEKYEIETQLTNAQRENGTTTGKLRAAQTVIAALEKYLSANEVNSNK